MRIVFLASRFPFPLEKGDKLRAYYHVKELSKRHEIILICTSDIRLSEQDIEELKPFCKRIIVHNLSKAGRIKQLVKTFFSRLPFQAGYFYSAGFHKRVKEVVAEEKPGLVFCQLARMAEYTVGLDSAKLLLDYQDAFSKGLERLAATSNFIYAFFIRWEWKRMLRYEEKIFDRFHYKIIISEQDKNFIPHPDRNNIRVIPNGVDFEYYQPVLREKKHDLIFFGNMNYRPNRESVLYLIHEILPLLRKKMPGIRLVIAGASPAAEIKKLQSETITVTGWVDDMREYIATSSIHVAPMRISIGLQNKILQAMAMKIPNVISRQANNAIQAVPGESVMVAETPEEYAGFIFQLLQDDVLNNRISEQAFRFVQQHFSWSASTAEIEEMIQP